MKNTKYRNCFKTNTESECVFASFTKSGGVHCCTIDRIIQTRWYGCIPQEIIDKKSKELEEELEGN
jgi:hypothetical protein